MSYRHYITPEEYEIAEKNGIPYRTVNNRVRGLGWDVERAITEKVMKQRRFNPEMVKLAKENGIAYLTFRKRVSDLKWDEYKAATTPPLSLEEIINNANEATRTLPKHIIELAEKNGISKQTLHIRINKGWDMEDAATMPTKVYKRKKKPQQVYSVYKGDKFICSGTAEECAEYLSVKIDTIRYYTSPAYQRKLSKRKRSKNPLMVIKLDGEAI